MEASAAAHRPATATATTVQLVGYQRPVTTMPHQNDQRLLLLQVQHQQQVQQQEQQEQQQRPATAGALSPRNNNNNNQTIVQKGMIQTQMVQHLEAMVELQEMVRTTIPAPVII